MLLAGDGGLNIEVIGSWAIQAVALIAVVVAASVMRMDAPRLSARVARWLLGRGSDTPSAATPGTDAPAAPASGSEPEGPDDESTGGEERPPRSPGVWLAILIASISLAGNLATAYLARSTPSPPDCVAYVEHLARLDADLKGDEERAFATVAEYAPMQAKCGDAGRILASLGGD